MDKSDELVTVAEYENSFDAELGKLTLDNAEIDSVIMGQDLVGNLSYGAASSITVQLQVHQKDAERARQVLAETEPLEADESDSDA